MSEPTSISQATPPAGDALAELSRLLWHQRTLIETLQYRLEVQQLVMTAGRDRHLAMAVEEVETALDDIRRVEITRDEVVADCAAALGLSPDSTLTQISTRAENPWDYVLTDHQSELLRLVADAESLAARNRELAARGLEDTSTLLRRITGNELPAGGHAGYGPSGTRTSTLALPPSLVDRDA